MKIDANVSFNPEMTALLGCCRTTVPVDMDYVEANSESIEDWVKNEIDEMFSCSCDAHGPAPFVVCNMDDLIEDIKFDEFQAKVNQ